MKYYHITLIIETISVSVMSGYPQDCGSVFCCYNYRVDWQHCMVHHVFHVIECVMSEACHTENQMKVHKMVATGKKTKADVSI